MLSAQFTWFLTLGLVLATVADCHFGSGSGSKPNHCQNNGPDCQSTQTVDSGIVRWWVSNPAELGRLSAGRPANASIDWIKALAFALCEHYLIKIAFSTTMDMFLHALQLVISINFELVFYLWYLEFLPITAVNNSVMNKEICALPWLPNMQHLILFRLYWHTFSGSCREHVAVVFASQGCQWLLNGCLQPIGK